MLQTQHIPIKFQKGKRFKLKTTSIKQDQAY